VEWTTPRPVTPPGQYGSVVSAVIFDFYGTLAHSAGVGAANYATSYQAIFAAHGFTLDQAALNDYYSRYDGVEHGEHSISEEAYEAWVRSRLRDLTGSCGVTEPHVEGLVDALRAVDQGAMESYPEAAATISSLREAGLAIGVCSNWGWELDAFLDQAGLLALIDVSITSARAGSRKPHPGIYDIAVSALGVEVEEVVFVGDAGEPDVRGPRRVGMMAVHVWREEERQGQCPPELQAGDHRVGDLTGVLEVINGLGLVTPQEAVPSNGRSRRS
jgi:putative hydrolase of the HAD superfamily